MKFSVMYNTGSYGVDPDAMIAVARHAEDCGFESFYVPEGLPTELSVLYRQNCFGDRFLLCLWGLTSALGTVRGLLPGLHSQIVAFRCVCGVAAAGLGCVGQWWRWVLRAVSRLGGSRAGWCGVVVPGG